MIDTATSFDQKLDHFDRVALSSNEQGRVTFVVCFLKVGVTTEFFKEIQVPITCCKEDWGTLRLFSEVGIGASFNQELLDFLDSSSPNGCFLIVILVIDIATGFDQQLDHFDVFTISSDE